MTRYILGIHDGHNASAALLGDGRLLGALQEERLTGVKNQGGIPRAAIAEILAKFDLRPSDVEVALNGHYMRHQGWDREGVLASYASARGPVATAKQALKGTPIDRAYQRRLARSRTRALTALGFRNENIHAIEHHTAHAASAYFGSGWTQGKTLVLTADGSGDRLSATVSLGEDGRLERIATVGEDDSLGRVYSTVTYLMGMVPLEHEYKLMGLAPYVSDAAKVERVAERFARLFEVDPAQPLGWKRKRGVPPLYAATDFLRAELEGVRFDLIAAGLQKFIEDALAQWVQRCVQTLGVSRVVAGGGVFMNVKANHTILTLPEVASFFVFPSCGDETNSIGAAWYHHAATETGGSRRPLPLDGFYLGDDLDPEATERAIKGESARGGLHFRHASDIDSLVADAIARGEVVARVRGPMEFGARALGNRSILARPDDPRAVRLINDMIKNRDFWMPFAPSALAERGDRYYERPKGVSSPYMMFAFRSHAETRDAYPAAQHPYDHTARTQEVFARHNPAYHKLLHDIEGRTGHGIVLNTSFNLHGFPIAYRAADALRVMRRSGLRNLALGDWWITKP